MTDGLAEVHEEEALALGLARRADWREHRTDKRDSLERDNGEDDEPHVESGYIRDNPLLRRRGNRAHHEPKRQRGEKAREDDDERGLFS